MRINMVCGKN